MQADRLAAAARDQLERFRRTRTARVLAVNGVDWPYFDSGGDGPIHLLLHGGLGDGESYFPMFEPLAATGRVVAPSIPEAVQGTTAAARGVASLLDAIGAPRVHVFGHSQGGYLAQVLVRAIPEKVASLALSATCLPSARRAETIANQLRLVGLTPGFLLRAGALAQLRRIASVDLKTLSPAEREFWMGYLTDGVRAPGLKSRAVASARLQLDYHRNARFDPGDLAHWQGRTLVLTYGLDPIIEPQEGRALIEHYPGASHRAFADEGHIGPFLHPDAVVGLLVRLAQAQPVP
jgi:pimeloyl-ACP methyl ester carboxylesterase